MPAKSLHEVQPAVRTKEFVVADPAATARFWDPLMRFLGWRRADDGIGAVVYEGGSAAIIFTSGDAWDRAANDLQRVSAFAHAAFDVRDPDELACLARSLERRAATVVDGPRPALVDGRWLHVLGFRDPDGLEIEVRCPR